MPAGRPPKYKTAEELQEKIDEYFEYIKNESERAKITSLCLFLGFCSRDSFYKYGDKDQFRYTIKKAHMRIEESYENLITDALRIKISVFMFTCSRS